MANKERDDISYVQYSPDRRISPKLTDDQPRLFAFRFYEAAVRGYREPATSGPWRSAQNFPNLPALDDWFTAANMNFALAHPGHDLSLLTDCLSGPRPNRRRLWVGSSAANG